MSGGQPGLINELASARLTVRQAINVNREKVVRYCPGMKRFII